MSLRPNHTLMRAVIASFLAHALLMLSVPRLLPLGPEAPSAAIAVVITHARTGAAQPSARDVATKTVATAAKPLVAARPLPPVNSGQKLVVRDQQSVAPVLPSSVVSAREAVATEVSTVSPGSGTARVGGGSAQTVASSLAAGSPVSGTDSVSADDVRQYRTSLAINARRFKHYPALAREREWEGIVEISLVFRRLLPDPEISIVSSSGRKMLDDQALEMIRQAAAVTDLPVRLRERDFRVLLPVTYSLDKEQ